MSICGKNTYPTKTEARRRIKVAKRCGYLPRSSLRIYWCKPCNGYHLTKKRK